ncbi:MAG: hypothetical protein OXS32_00075 [Verrucomicrobiales bacterium]|nr:hypothetical protein [Verrucomicrobiales bacterium]
MSDKPQEPENSERIAAWTAWRWPLVVVILSMFALIAFVYVLRTPERLIESAGKGAAGVAGALENAAANFQRATITKTFTASLPDFESERGGLLELAKVTATESFKSQDELKYDFRWFELSAGTTTTEIRVPVTYRYHLRMRDTWRLDVADGVCFVYAPAIRPSQPPAVHTDKLEKSSDEGWARFNVEEQMMKLEKTITPTIRKYAADERHLAAVRENCRKTVEEFVQDWLIRENQWGDGKLRVVKVFFLGETGPGQEVGVLPAEEPKTD